MSNKVIVMVYDSDDTRHGEISILESAHKAAHWPFRGAVNRTAYCYRSPADRNHTTKPP